MSILSVANPDWVLLTSWDAPSGLETSAWALDGDGLGAEGFSVGYHLCCAGSGGIRDIVDDDAGTVLGDGCADAIFSAGTGYDGGFTCEGEGCRCH
jgi:hypothetical protein